MKQLPNHRAHHYPTLIRRWRAVAKAAGLAMLQYGEHDGFPLYVLKNRRPVVDAPEIYLSAGIHGDEPAGPEAILAWALKHPKMVQRANFTIFPCLNPWGLTANIRTDSQGIDLNRQFHDSKLPSLQALHNVIEGRHYSLALALHEDYDGQGLYIYELNGAPTPLAPLLLEAAAHIIPTDPRTRIDGRRFIQTGYFHRNPSRRKLPDGPETIFLARRKVGICLTIETPSEFSLDHRIHAQRIIVQAAIKHVLHRDPTL